MAFTGSAKADNNPGLPFLEIGLIRIFDHGWIEKGR